MTNIYSELSPEVKSYVEKLLKNNSINPELYQDYDVFRGLRDLNGNGVLTGLTEISEIEAFKMVDGKKKGCEGKLFYRGVNVQELVKGVVNEKRCGFEETVYLLLFGELPGADDLKQFTGVLSKFRSLPTHFVRDIIMKAPSKDMMNTLARSVLTMYSYDDMASDTSTPNVLRQCLELIALFPLFAVYGYQAYNHYEKGEDLYIHSPVAEYSTAENILHILRKDSQFTELEARLLDLCLILHAEHGGGNNSTFTCHVVSSSGTDTYSAIAAALGSLKGPKHGGANIKVTEMFNDIQANVQDWTDEEEIKQYLIKLLRKEAYDKSGLIYGMGHAVYSKSDPRAEVLKGFVSTLAQEKGREKEFALYANVERIAPLAIAEERKIYKGVSANVDFYSGFVYNMLDLPTQLYTPLFAIARIAGWSAHRIEELVNAGKIIRPAYMNVHDRVDYVPLGDR